MNKIPGKLLVSMMLSGVMISGFAIPALAENVVTVSSLPSSASSSTSSNNQNKTSVTSAIESGDGVASNKSATPIITAVANVQTANVVTSQSVSTVSSSESGKVTIPVINAADTIEAYNTKNAASSEQKSTAATTEKTVIVDTTLESISFSGQTATEVGFCVILSSSPTGLMTDISV